MSESVYILGAGGHGRVVLDALLASGVEVMGFLDPQPQTRAFLGVRVLGGDEYLNNLPTTEICLVNGLGANPHIFRRQKIFEIMKSRFFTFNRVQHPSAIISSAAKLGEGCQIMAGGILQPGVILGENVVINTGCKVDHDCLIGSHAFIGPGVTLCGDIRISNSVFIGAGAVVLPGISIGENTIVGAGSIVTKSIPDGCIVVGNPAVKTGVNSNN